jgi:hypothetical protein
VARPKKEPVVYSVTSAATSTTDDQDQRVRRYLTMMGIRVVCFGLVFVTSGWMRWAAIIGAVVIPYFAVVIANAVRPSQVGTIQAVTPAPDETHRIDQ